MDLAYCDMGQAGICKTVKREDSEVNLRDDREV